MKRILLLATWFATALSSPAEVPLTKDATILFYGNSMVERLLESGEMEARIQLALPEKKLRIRSLAWTGDEVGWRLRPEGYVEHLKTLLAKWPANVVVLGYGMNESFAGHAGLKDFRSQYELLLRDLKRLHPEAKLVLLSPIAVEDDERRNSDVAAYSAAIAELAGGHDALFVDLFSTSQAAYRRSATPLTMQGIHLNEAGAREIGAIIAREFVGEAALARVATWRVDEVARAAARKSHAVAEIVRPKNGVVYYGVRKRPEENAAELPRYHGIIEQSEVILHALVSKPDSRLADFPPPSLPPLPEGKTVPDRFSGGVLKAPAEQMHDLAVAEGYALNLFASEEQFPELKNPVQMAFDARGRLWLVTMPSFPHTVPGEQPRDKILILEDSDRDGRADKCTVFADGFDALDGVAFHEKGIIVSAQPRLLILRDTDGDDRADTQTELLRGVDVTDSHHGGMIATDPLGHLIFSDGVFHRSQFETPFGVVRGIDSTTYRLHPASGRVETEWQGMTPNPWKVSFDRHGNMFQRFGGGHVLDGLQQTWTPLGIWHPYGNGTVLNYAKGCALSVISSPNFPAEFQQGIASATLLGSYTVSISKVTSNDGPIVATDRIDLLTSQNSAFRPVDCEFGFDGALYVSDFASRIIGHAQHPMRDPQWNHTLGRIWRVISKAGPVPVDWPKIEGATMRELIALLDHPQNIVRHHARIQLRAKGAEAVAALDGAQLATEQAKLEALWVLAASGQARPAWLSDLAKSADPLIRAAAVQLVRFLAAQLPDGHALLAAAAQDAHPRVRMAAIHTAAHLRANGDMHAVHAIGAMAANESAVRQMLDDLKAGTTAAKGRSVPVLDVAPESEVKEWLFVGETGATEQKAYPAAGGGKGGGKNSAIKTRTYRTYFEADAAQTALLNVRHGYLDVAANGVQILSADSPYSSQHQLQLELRKGLNVVEIAYRRSKPVPPPVFICDPLGYPLRSVRFPADQKALAASARAWETAHAADANALHVRAVPNLMQFAPKELRIKRGAMVRIIFENPDLMQHNLVLVAIGADEEVGALADRMATQPDALAKHYLPDTKKILHATPLVNPNGRAELNFTAPSEPGRYPYLCTFPGHWRVMRGVLLVE